MENDNGKEMPLSVAFIRVFSVLMVLIGAAEFIISCILIDASNSNNFGGIYFAVTALCSGFWGLFMIEGVRQFNMLSLFLFINVICAIVGVLYAGIALYVVDRIEACSEFDPSGNEMPRCTDQINGSYSNFTCSGNEAYFLDAAKCGTRFINSGSSTSKDCGCVYVDSSTHCKEFVGYDNCSDMQDILPPLSMGSYVLGYMCLSLSVFLLVCSCTAACYHSKRRGLMSLSTVELRRGPGELEGNQQQSGGISRGLRGNNGKGITGLGLGSPPKPRSIKARVQQVSPSTTTAAAAVVTVPSQETRGATDTLSPA